MSILHFGKKKKKEEKKVYGWVNFYPDNFISAVLFESEEEADRNAHPARLGKAQYIEHKY